MAARLGVWLRRLVDASGRVCGPPKHHLGELKGGPDDSDSE